MHSNNKPRNKTNSKNIARTFLLSNPLGKLFTKTSASNSKSKFERTAFYRQTFCFYSEKMILFNSELLLKTISKTADDISNYFFLHLNFR